MERIELIDNGGFEFEKYASRYISFEVGGDVKIRPSTYGNVVWVTCKGRSCEFRNLNMNSVSGDCMIHCNFVTMPEDMSVGEGECVCEYTEEEVIGRLSIIPGVFTGTVCNLCFRVERDSKMLKTDIVKGEVCCSLKLSLYNCAHIHISDGVDLEYGRIFVFKEKYDRSTSTRVTVDAGDRRVWLHPRYKDYGYEIPDSLLNEDWVGIMDDRWHKYGRVKNIFIGER